MRKLRIAQISKPFEAVPPPLYGGSERVISNLTEELVRRGHDVVLFATGDSCTKAELRWTYSTAQRDYGWVADEIHTTRAFQAADEFDIIHNHTYPGIRYATLVSTPAVHTIHNLIRDDIAPMYQAFREQNFITVSRSQLKCLPELNYLGHAYNGIDTELHSAADHQDDYVLHIGNLCPEKGTDVAVDAALKAGVRLILAGRVPPHAQTFYDERIAPRLRPGSVEFVGEVGGSARIKLFQEALALVAPIRWEESFGLVFTEAMSCGTPVIAAPRGSVPEIVLDGITGFHAATPEAVADAILRVGELDRVACRQRVLDYFSISTMTDAYEDHYVHAIEHR